MDMKQDEKVTQFQSQVFKIFVCLFVFMEKIEWNKISGSQTKIPENNSQSSNYP